MGDKVQLTRCDVNDHNLTIAIRSSIASQMAVILMIILYEMPTLLLQIAL